MGDGSDGSAAQTGGAGRLIRGVAVALAAVAAAGSLGVAPRTAQAQFTTRSWKSWRTVDTRHFSLHYPLDLQDWTLALAGHIEAIDSAVSLVVGATPSRRTQIVVDDPYSQANGSAWPFMREPVIDLWATPPNPREDIGQFSDWGEMLVAHEFAHIAHLTRPSRNPAQRLLWRLAPATVGPTPIQAPRWVIEGYATYVEGKVTGSGRPHGTWRPAILREWALEGQLPTYAQMSAWSDFEGGEFAYLAGSAFLQWLTERPGQSDSSLVHVWRRLTARQARSFDDAFAGVFGDAPPVLYGLFRADLTARALQARALERAAGLDTGEIVQRLAWGTGDPAISPDGKRVAVTVHTTTKPARLVIFATAPAPDTSRARRDSALLRRDPQDVPARPIYPAPRRVLASLEAVGPYAYQAPRWLHDGRILAWRLTAQGDGTARPALYLWNPRTRSVARVPHSTGLSDADPLPDGSAAVATRCLAGRCDVVRVNLASGAITLLAAGDNQRSYYRARVSPDGRMVIAAASLDGRWRLVRIASQADVTPLDPDDGANRYDATFLNADTLICVSELGGVPNIELLPISSGGAPSPLTRVTGAAVAPELNPADGSIWFLSLYSRGYDLRRVTRGTTLGSVVQLPDSLSPAAPIPPERRTPLALNPVSAPRAYGAGPRTTRWVPVPEYGADGANAVLEVMNSDVIGRALIEARASVGDPSTWRGGDARLTWNGTRPGARLELFSATQRLSNTAELRAPITANPLDVRLTGGLVSLDQAKVFETVQLHGRVTGAVGRLTHLAPTWFLGAAGSSRVLEQASGDASAAVQKHWGALHVAAAVHGAVTLGREGSDDFMRETYAVSATASGILPLPVAGAVTRVHSSARDAFEQASFGGGPAPVLDQSLLDQRILMAVLPSGVGTGPDAVAYRLSVPFAGLSPYLWAARGAACVRGTDDCTTWNRVVGAEWSSSVPAIPYAGTPPVRAVLGVGRSLDAPFRHQIRGYVTVVVNP